MKPRIVITIVTKTGSTDFRIVTGAETTSGVPSLGPSKKQFDLAYKAIRQICEAK